MTLPCTTACQNRYRTILREKAALVVIDDVWDVASLEQLLVEAPPTLELQMPWRFLADSRRVVQFLTTDRRKKGKRSS